MRRHLGCRLVTPLGGHARLEAREELLVRCVDVALACPRVAGWLVVLPVSSSMSARVIVGCRSKPITGTGLIVRPPFSALSGRFHSTTGTVRVDPGVPPVLRRL